MKKIIPFILGMFLVMLSPLNALAYNDGNNGNIPPEVVSTAEQGINLFKKLASESPTDYGFSSVDEVNRMELGQGYQLYRIVPEKLKSDENTDSLVKISELSDEWEFIVKVNGEPKSFLTVGKTKDDNRLVVTGFGGKSETFMESMTNFDRITSTSNKTSTPLIVKEGNIRYIVCLIDDIEYNMPDVPPGPKSLLTGNTDNTQIWPSYQTVTFLKQQLLNDDGNSTGGANYIKEETVISKNFILNTTTVILIAGILLVAMIFKKRRVKL